MSAPFENVTGDLSDNKIEFRKGQIEEIQCALSEVEFINKNLSIAT